MKTLKPKHTCGMVIENKNAKSEWVAIFDLDKHTCSCNFWDLVGIPCRHVVVSIGRALENPQSYVHTYYHKKNLFELL